MSTVTVYGYGRIVDGRLPYGVRAPTVRVLYDTVPVPYPVPCTVHGCREAIFVYFSDLFCVEIVSKALLLIELFA
jgi:hypothetical protein